MTKTVIHKTYKGYDYIAFEGYRDIMRIIDGYVKLPEKHPDIKTLKYSPSLIDRIFIKFLGPINLNYENLDINVHGGLTFGKFIKSKDIKNWEQGFTPGYWIGWDYAHLFDALYANDKDLDGLEPKYRELLIRQRKRTGLFKNDPKDHYWTLDEVEIDCINVIEQLIKREVKNGNPK